MRGNTNYSSVIILSFIILRIVHSNSCSHICGGIQIPFPFGIEENCFLNEWYEIDCRRNVLSGQDFPFLAKMNMEVVNISLPFSYDNSYGFRLFSTIRVKNPITSMGCSTDGEELGSPLNLTGTPFFLGEENSLIAVGCNVKASLTNVEPNIVGCESTCTTSNKSQSIPFFDQVVCSSGSTYITRSILPENYQPVCKTTKIKEDSDCNGFGCCQAKAPVGAGQQLIGVKMADTTENLTTGGKCNVAFLTDEVYNLSNATTPETFFSKGYATINLGWFIQTKNHKFRESLNCKNREEVDKRFSRKATIKCTCENRTISGISYASCACLSGYRGNPYLSDDCEDIDECVESLNHCESYHTCRNKPGGYNCVNSNEVVVKIGLSVGFAVLVMVVGVWLLIKFRRKRRKVKRKREFFERNGGLLLQQQLNTSQGNVENTKIFSSRELKKATDNFSENMVLGQGGQGTVYKGTLVDGKHVAIKKSSVVDEDKVQEFINEVFILSQINHRHVVKLLGCCLETEVPILVYEFITNGNLFQHLHGEFDDFTELWGVRMRIAVDIAGAFSYLHSAACSPIYHRDIKSTNILLDEKYRAKVADFGTSRSVTIDHTHWTTLVSGTIGYVDPEYYGSSHFTEKSDVYSFGVVLAELITGQKPVITLLNPHETTGLADYFRLAMKENRFFDIIDPRIRNDCKLEQVIAVANLAMRCLKKMGKNRPDMREVSAELERISSSPEDFQVQIHIDGEEETMKLYRGDSWSTVTTRTNVM